MIMHDPILLSELSDNENVLSIFVQLVPIGSQYHISPRLQDGTLCQHRQVTMCTLIKTQVLFGRVFAGS